MAPLRKISGFGKYWQTPKILAESQNVGGFTKCWRLPKYWWMYKMLAPSKILADVQNVGVWQKYRRTIESWRALKSPRLVNYQRIWKKLAARLLFGLGGISNCDFLLDWLKSSRSDPRRYVASLSCRPQVRTQPRLLCFYGRSPSCTVPAACTGPTCQNICGSQNYWQPRIFSPIPVKTQILSRLLSVLSLSRKFVYDHCCRPKSAIIITASKLEAILDFWRGYRKTVPNDMGGGLSLGPLILIT